MKTLLVAVLAALTCTLMACSSAGGPTETEGTSSTSSSETAARYYYSCGGGPAPCSEQKAEEIMSSPSYERSTGSFRESDSTCKLIYCTNNCPSS